MSDKKEYIERGALLKTLGCEDAVKYGNKTAEQQHNSYSTMMLYEIADVICDAPAADVEPVVRGEWKPDDRMFGVWHCSVCGESALCNGVEEEVKSAFCPHCGAKMNLN